MKSYLLPSLLALSAVVLGSDAQDNGTQDVNRISASIKKIGCTSFSSGLDDVLASTGSEIVGPDQDEAAASKSTLSQQKGEGPC